MLTKLETPPEKAFLILVRIPEQVLTMLLVTVEILRVRLPNSVEPVVAIVLA
jgi:hypothetical protein